MMWITIIQKAWEIQKNAGYTTKIFTLYKKEAISVVGKSAYDLATDIFRIR